MDGREGGCSGSNWVGVGRSGGESGTGCTVHLAGHPVQVVVGRLEEVDLVLGRADAAGIVQPDQADKADTALADHRTVEGKAGNHGHRHDAVAEAETSSCVLARWVRLL